VFLLKVIRSLDEHGVGYGIVGGFAMVLHGVVRGTMDIDLILALTEESFVKAEQALNRIGLVSRLPVNSKGVFDFREEYINQRNLIGWSFYNPKNPSEVVDIIINEDLRKMKVVKINFAGLQIKVVSVNDLIKMKRRAGREQDFADIKALEILQKKLKG
jgi:predicted nucleotidyltransferase